MDNLSGGDFSDILAKLMSDEKFGEIVEAVKGSFSANAENDPPPESDTSSTESSAVTESSPIRSRYRRFFRSYRITDTESVTGAYLKTAGNHVNALRRRNTFREKFPPGRPQKASLCA